MKIYTRTGDSGETGLFGGPRVSKSAARIEAYGTVDELNAALGVVRAGQLTDPSDAYLARVQHELFDVGAELATPDPIAKGTNKVGRDHVAQMEHQIDRMEKDLPPLRSFILPGGCRAAALLHVARCVCRRAERRMVTLSGEEAVSGDLIAYVNRLSDLLFVMARFENQSAGREDVIWEGRG
ncbi:MAG: cob(I)yrinic acid a,c-diamide adenosyltransferase [Pirellulales bacterium]